MHATADPQAHRHPTGPAPARARGAVSAKPPSFNPLALRLATAVPGAPVLQRYASGSYSYGHTESCPKDFLESHVWLGHDRAFKMVKHAIYGLCAAQHGNKTARNKEARVQMVSVFGSDWLQKAQAIYNALWKIRVGLENKFTYDCDTTGKIFCPYDPPGNVEWANTGGSDEINLCYENLARRSRDWFAHIIIHETAHRSAGLGHGTDDESMTCNGEPNDAQCFALLAEGMDTALANYTEGAGDLCMGGGPTSAKLWDD